MATIMVMKDKDNVAVCLAEKKAGETVQFSAGGVDCHITLLDDIPFAHKFALADIDRGEKVLKYGEGIGLACTPIKVGQWVHVHNIESVRARGDKQ